MSAIYWFKSVAVLLLFRVLAYLVNNSRKVLRVCRAGDTDGISH